MTPQELRIGNWIQHEVRNFTFQVDSGTFSYLERNPDFYQPIQLTSEWLEKFGFEKRENPDTTYDEKVHGHGGNVIHVGA